MFFVANADANGAPDCSCKGGRFRDYLPHGKP
jgi:hypothetical protein